MINPLRNKRTKANAPKCDVFISHSGKYKASLAIPLQELFQSIGYEADKTFVDETSLSPGTLNGLTAIDTALAGAKVVLILVDDNDFIRSEYCMKESKDAIQRYKKTGKGLVFPLFLCRFTQLPTSTDEIKNIVGQDCDAEDLLKTVFDLRSITGWRSTGKGESSIDEDRVYQPEHIVAAIDHYLRNNQKHDPPTLLKVLQDDQLKKRVEQIRVQSGQAHNPCIWRIVNPIKECIPPQLKRETVKVHNKDFQKIFTALTRETSSVSIAGLKAAGGVGKTVLAQRIALDKRVQEQCAPDGVLWSEFGQFDSTAKPALLRIWQDLGGEKDKLSLKEDKSGQLSNARRRFEELFAKTHVRVLLVLDDVWDKKYLEVFENVVKKQSNVKVLVTTRFIGTVATVFRQEVGRTLIDLNTCLSLEDSLALMRSYAGINQIPQESNSDDNKFMEKIAAKFGYHAKALSIISVQYESFESSWADLLAAIENSTLGLDGTSEAKDWVAAATEHTLAGASKERKLNLEEYFAKLGVFVEGARYSRKDLCILWGCAMYDTKPIAKALVGCSLLERENSSNSDTAAIYHMHDLVRDRARHDEARTNVREQEFLQNLADIVRNEPERATGYIFKYLPQHEQADRKFRLDIDEVFSNAKEGKFKQKWSSNEFVVLTATAKDLYESALSEASIGLCKKERFFEKALQLQERLKLSDQTEWTKRYDTMELFAASLGKCKRLVSLDLWDNGIHLEGIQALAAALAANTSLRTLVLWRNGIGPEGALALGQALEVNDTLQRLKRNQIGPEGAKFLAAALHKNGTLHTLNLEWNRIGPEGAQFFAVALRVNKALLTLDLRANKIGEAGAVALGQALQINQVLTDLNVHGNDIEEIGRGALGPYAGRVKT